MKTDNVIEVKDITKKFKVFLDKGHTLKELTLFSKRRKYEEREVLKGISFEVKKGEAIGLIGHNGCGKSTTLKLLTRIMYPDSGTIEMKGRVSSLIELGAGFHPDMSGRQNIYTNASIFGLTRKEIDARLDEIIAFSELEEFIDNPVRTYSSGMYMRLAFAVAINVDADILLIDEILAVGDANFQAKCFERLRELKAAGVTTVIVTHDTGVVERFCDHAIWINDGKAVAAGKSIEVVDAYLSYMNGKRIESIEHEEERKREKQKGIEYIKDENISEEVESSEKKDEKSDDDVSIAEKSEEELLYEQAMDYNVKHFGNKKAAIKNCVLKNNKGKVTTVIRSEEKYSIEIQYEVKKELKELVFGMGIYTLDGVWIFGTNTLNAKIRIPYKENEGTIIFESEPLHLLTNKYILQVSITEIDGTPVDFYREYCQFNVINNSREAGIIRYNTRWIL